MADPDRDLHPVPDPNATSSDRMAECVARIVEEFGSTLELDEVLQRVAEGIRQHIDYDTFAILLLEDLGQELRFDFAVGFPDEVVDNWRFGMGQGLVGRSAETQQAVSVGDVREDSHYIGAAADLRAEISIPLVVKGRTIGVLDVGSRKSNHFTREDEELLKFLAGHLANGIENARLYENVREQARTLSLLHESSRELTSILDRETLLSKVADMVRRLINYDLFSVMHWNEESQVLEHTFSRGFDSRFCKKDAFPLGRGVTGTAAALRQPMRVPNVHLSPHYCDCGHGVEVRSELAVPLVFKDRLIGVLDLESVEYNAFSEQQEQMLSTLASYVAVALENARLYAKVTEDERRLEVDLEMAREIQRGLLPDKAPKVPGLDVGFAYKPARHLGGDFYDFLPYGGKGAGFAVGDVAGKGTPAALFASLAVGVLRGYVVEHRCGPANMMNRLNRELGEHRIDNRFVAMTFGVFNSESGELALSNGGFPRPMLLRGGKVQDLPLEGVPLGMFPDVVYKEEKLTLAPGEVVAFCSDGICESINNQREEFGARRLQARLIELAGRSAQEIAAGLLESAERYVENSRSEPDDRTVVVLKAV